MKKVELTELRYSWFSLETVDLLRNLGVVLMAPPNVYDLYDQCAFLFGFTLLMYFISVSSLKFFLK